MGVVFSIDQEGDVRVRYGENAFFINPEALVKVKCRYRMEEYIVGMFYNHYH